MSNEWGKTGLLHHLLLDYWTPERAMLLLCGLRGTPASPDWQDWAIEQRLYTPKQEAAKLFTTERNTLLIIIAALLKGTKMNLDAKGAAGFVVKLTEDIGVPLP